MENNSDAKLKQLREPSVSNFSAPAENTVSGPTTFEDLPNELLSEIVSYLRLSEYGESARSLQPHADRREDEYPQFKALRLVNRRLHALATPILFETLIVLSRPESWKALNNIASSPNLAHLVKTVQIASHFKQDNKYRLAEAISKDSQEDQDGSFHHQQTYGLIARPDQRDLEFQRRHISCFYGDGEEQMRMDFDAAPPLALPLFTNLTTIETVGHKELVIVRKTRHDPTSRRKRQKSCFRLPELQCDINEGHLQTFNNAIIRSGWHLNNLVLRCPRELLARRSVVFDTLRRLEIEMNSHNVVQHITYHQLFAASWVWHLQNLEEFAVTGKTQIFPPTWGALGMSPIGEDIFSLFESYEQKITWPRLTKVSQKNDIIPFEPLSSFLMRHATTLQSFHANNIEMKGGSWSQLLRVLAEAGIKDIVLLDVKEDLL